MAKSVEMLDVWFCAADTVYTGVPLQVVMGWAEQGRVSPDDNVRSSADKPWVRIAEHPILAGFLMRKRTPAAVRKPASRAVISVPVSVDDLDLEPPTKPRIDDEDDDVDMIPLIDISLVLLIFFMMTMAVASVSPIQVPALVNSGTLKQPDDSLTIQIDRRVNGEVFFSLCVGNSAATRDDDKLTSEKELLTRLDTRIAQHKTPPHVFVACHEKLPSLHMHSMMQELSNRKAKKLIAGFDAEVSEKRP